jgi:cysteine protease ATG4
MTATVIQSHAHCWLPLLDYICVVQPQAMGFVGGSPSSSYYFIAGQTDETSCAAGDQGGERVIYLDPHVVQPVVNVCAEGNSTESYHCRNFRSMKLSSIDPSLTIGFLLRDQIDLDALCEALPKTMGGEICAVFETQPPEPT